MNHSFYDGNFITVSDIVQFYYCPRKIYFLKTLNVPHPQRYKMEFGVEQYEKELQLILRRKSIFGFSKEEIKNIFKKTFVQSSKIGLSGRIDLAIELNNDELIPIEMKFTDFNYPSFHWKKQLTAYAMLLEEHFNTSVKRGIIYLIQQKKQFEIPIRPVEKKFILTDIKKITNLITSERIPRKTDKNKCKYCEMIKYCV